MTPTPRTFATVVSVVALSAASLVATTTVTGANAATRAAAIRLDANLRPSGDPNGTGHATVRLNRAERRVCATITYRRIDTPDAAHIHKKSDGSVFIDLTNAADGRGCTRAVPKRTIRAVTDHPRRYYVNVHNATYPPGAIQGNLRR